MIFSFSKITNLSQKVSKSRRKAAGEKVFAAAL